jgi:hypothetical protein
LVTSSGRELKRILKSTLLLAAAKCLKTFVHRL